MYENTAELRKALKAQNPLEPPSERLLATGLATGRCHQGHDQVLDCLFTEQAKARKSEIVGNFLVGVERNEASLRAAMSAFACATHLPKHPFTVHDQLTCQVCSAFEQIDVNFMQLNRVRFFVGAVLGGDILHIAFMLQEHNAAAKLRPENFDLMVSVIDLIRNVPAPTKPKELLKLLRKLPGIKMSEEEGRGSSTCLGTAAYCRRQSTLACCTAIPTSVWHHAAHARRTGVTRWTSGAVSMASTRTPCTIGSATIPSCSRRRPLAGRSHSNSHDHCGKQGDEAGFFFIQFT
ncbi:hypothetical protein LOY42_25175 [Pseudomonas sp. B21-023]|uniref:hypothetical protein n=1 Tax=Pseudomonas sp. B21-023 TaxID=2895477 RepID=UPI002160E0E4|nr:hypothetical protein [Pseudomonas sp. B21-023]UVM16506.1 hypothetical protein LOY42_25175 [Pseudomonas sp. B21-023]